MYIEKISRNSGNNFELIEDLAFVLNNEGFTINRLDLITKPATINDPEKGKELIVQKGQSFWSFNASKYPRVSSLTNLNTYEDNATTIFCGFFACYINSGYDPLVDSSLQPKYRTVNTVKRPVCAALNKEGRARYKIYASPDGWDFLVTTQFDGYTFFVAFGNKSKGQTDQGNYHLGSYFDPLECGIPKDLNTTSPSSLPINPFMGKAGTSNNSSLFFMVDTFNNVSDYSVNPNLFFQNVGSDRISYNESFIKGLHEEYSGINNLLRADFFVSNTEEDPDIMKKFYDFDMGVANQYTFEDGEERTINGKRYKFHHLCKRIENQDYEASVNKGNLGFWFQLGDKRV